MIEQKLMKYESYSFQKGRIEDLYSKGYTLLLLIFLKTFPSFKCETKRLYLTGDCIQNEKLSQP